MLRAVLNHRAVIALAALLALAVPFAAAQERGEEILGTITKVDGRDLVVKHEDGRVINVRVTSGTEVYFTDSGDRRLFPNPVVGDLRAGMGVRFVYGSGTLDRISVHYVPAGYTRESGPGPAPAGGSERMAARIESIDRTGRTLRADVAGRSRTFEVEDRREAQGFRAGDMVVLTVEDRAGRPVVVRIEPGDYVGTITRIGARGRSVTIDLNGRQETYGVDDREMLGDLREGDRVRFEVVEKPGGRQVLTQIKRDKGAGKGSSGLK